MKLTFSANHPRKWFSSVTGQLGITARNGLAKVPYALGGGYLRQYLLPGELYLTIMDMKLHQATQARHTSNSQAEYFPLLFFLPTGQLHQSSEKTEASSGEHSPAGVFFPSPKVETRFSAPPGAGMLIVTVTATKEWLLSHFHDKPRPYFIQLLNGENDFLLYEPISPDMKLALQQIIDKDTNTPMFLFAKAIELLALFVQKINSRPYRQAARSLLPRDIERMFRAKHMLDTQLATPPTLDVLAKETGVGKSKLQRNFRATFGQSVYQYALKARMIEAHRLLASGRFSVAEIGRHLGYSSMSQFRKAFRKEFGVSPGEFRDS